MTTTINADNGVSSGSAGLKSSADSSGVLALQTNGTTAMTVGTDQSILMTGAPSIGGAGYGMGMGFRNRIINGAMVIDQRNAGASVTPTNGAYLVDRFQAILTQASKFTAQQNAGSVTPPAGFIKYLGCTSSSAYSVLAGDVFSIQQSIEGLNVADLGWGTANAQTVTFSFWVRSSLTGTFAGTLQNSAQTYSYVFTYSVPSANTWTYITVAIAGQTAGTWNTDNTSWATLRFTLGAGSTYQTATTNAWVAGNVWSTSSAVSVVGTNGATFYITGVQLEKGSTATAFDYRDYGREMIMCQRYYTQFGLEQANSQLSPLGVAYQATTAVFPYILPVKMRSQPTITVATAELIEWQTLTSWATTTYSSPTGQNATQSPLIAVNIGTSSMTAGRVYTVRATSTSGNVTFSSEL